MTQTALDTRIAEYVFPVAERPVYFEPDEETGAAHARRYKAIVHQQTGKLISIQRDTYRMVSNQDVIAPLLDQLQTLDTSWYIDPSHSFVLPSRMRLQITFPELRFHDGRSDIALSLYLHNSYDSSEGVRMMFGAIRAICKNGMVFGQVLSQFYGKHTLNFNLHSLREQLESTYEKIPVIQERITQLIEARVTSGVRKEVEERIGKGAARFLETQEREIRRVTNQWALYNVLTYFVSHEVKQQHRAAYQMKVSQLFDL